MKKLALILFTLLSLNSYGQLVIQTTTSTSGTVTCQNSGQDILLIHSAGVTLTLTVEFPSTPFNGQRVTITSNSGITTLTITAVVGTIGNEITNLGAGSAGRYIYNADANKWFKI
jgi:hypothetical protein